VACPHCGPKREDLPWLARYSRVTRRMAENVARLCQVLPIKQVAEYFGLSWDTVKAVDRVRVDEANRQLTTVYVLKDDLKHLWDYVYEGAARRFWEQWYNRAVFSRIESLRACPRTRAGAPFQVVGSVPGQAGKKFARRLQEHLPGILAHCRWPLHISLLEGINNKIKVIKRMASGFRDDDYFFLKIRAAFPGNT